MSDYRASSILQFFEHDHLPVRLSEVSKPFRRLAHLIDITHENNAEKSVALRKLLEAKDAAVRSALFTPEEQ